MVLIIENEKFDVVEKGERRGAESYHGNGASLGRTMRLQGYGLGVRSSLGPRVGPRRGLGLSIFQHGLPHHFAPVKEHLNEQIQLGIKPQHHATGCPIRSTTTVTRFFMVNGEIIANGKYVL